MTYETTMDFLIQSCIAKEVDDLKSASSRIALGQVPQFGTGSFSLLQNAAKEK
jgi:hypothetical protein